MFTSEKKNLYIGGLIIVILVIMYFLHSYQTKKLIHDELKNIAKEKKRKLLKEMVKLKKANLNKQKEYPDLSDEDKQNDINMNQQEMDSYIDICNDGGNGDTVINQIPQQPPSHSGSRMSANNIMMRDMMDGSHQ
jgi:hypothetical protein